MPERRKRIHMLDEIRGFAIICMIFHHAFLDVGDVIGLEWGYEIFDALCTVQPIFWTIFIVISGMCSRLSRNTVKRGILVLVCAGIITLATAVIMPLLGFVGAEIYFGILHCLGTCMVITGLLMPLFKKIDFRIGAAVSLILFLFVYGIEGGKICFGLISLPESWYQFNILAPVSIMQAFIVRIIFPFCPGYLCFSSEHLSEKLQQMKNCLSRCISSTVSFYPSLAKTVSGFIWHISRYYMLLCL